jgi:hypothetical protein
MRLVRRAPAAWLALLGLAAVTVAVEYLPHTDDGCGVEVHCLACRTSVGHTATTATAVVFSAPGDFVEWLPVLIPPAPERGNVRTTDSRGPPLG